jgi:hypothetical protein
LPRYQRAQAHNSTHYHRQLSFMFWLSSKQNRLLCAYEHDFGNNYIITMGRAHTTGENGEWGETKQRSENQVAFNSVLWPSEQHNFFLF